MTDLGSMTSEEAAEWARKNDTGSLVFDGPPADLPDEFEVVGDEVVAAATTVTTFRMPVAMFDRLGELTRGKAGGRSELVRQLIQGHFDALDGRPEPAEDELEAALALVVRAARVGGTHGVLDAAA